MNIRHLPTALFILFVFLAALQIPDDPDLWWHLRTGEYVLENGIPDTDPFTYTVRDEPWGMHEWLSDVTMFKVWDWLGFNGLAVVFALLIAAAFALIYFNTPGRPYLAFFLASWAVIIDLPAFNPRPNMFNIFFGAVFIFLLDGWRQGKLSRRWLWLLPATTLLWVNLHSGFLLGICIMGVYLVGGWAEHWLRPGQLADDDLSLDDLRWLGLMLGLSAVVSLANPGLYRIWWFPIETHFSNSAILANINEWQSPDFGNPFFWLFGIMMLGGFTLFIYSPRKVSFTEILLFGGLAATSLLSRRNMLFFVIPATPIIAHHLLALLENTPAYPLLSGERPAPPTPRWQAILNVGIVIAVAVAGGVRITDRLAERPAVVADWYPVAAVEYMADEGLKDERVFSWFGWGGYLIWQDIPTFIDGRADLFGSDFFATYLAAEQGRRDWQTVLDDYDVQVVLFPADHFALTSLLALSPDWQEVYRDDVAVIFQRRAEPSTSLLG